MINIEWTDREGRLTLATDIFLQCLWILSTSCLTSSARMRDLWESPRYLKRCNSPTPWSIFFRTLADSPPDLSRDILETNTN